MVAPDGARDVGDIVNAVSQMCRQFGDIRRWRFTRLANGRRLGLFISLEDPARHAEVASMLEGREIDGEVYFEVALGERR